METDNFLDCVAGGVYIFLRRIMESRDGNDLPVSSHAAISLANAKIFPKLHWVLLSSLVLKV